MNRLMNLENRIELLKIKVKLLLIKNLFEFNPRHDARGRFATGTGSGSSAAASGEGSVASGKNFKGKTEADKWASSKSSLNPGLSASEERALKQYKGNGYKDINGKI